MRVTGGSAVAGAGGTAARRVAGAGFSVAGPEPPGQAVAVAGVAVAGLLAVQEAGREDVRDREARRHGEAVLAALARLQLALLRGDVTAATTLAALLDAAPAPSDPALAQVQRALLQRAAVEAARTRAAASR